MSDILVLSVLAEVVAILWDVTTGGNGILTGAAFLLLTVIVAPAWAIWLARLMAHGAT